MHCRLLGGTITEDDQIRGPFVDVAKSQPEGGHAYQARGPSTGNLSPANGAPGER